ncbi:SDR family NAD(P)-dependent oxidoreductase [Vibrio algarum]|uniref:SDR family NAD(P)-dependent oxidoreductase n=1 Tax=Vibrio algarum TaxID=3020714 RepID=A0ABT4YTV6_9VIBR|nr:SDR family NAD(P)-dependent oxidoreductase [Vibrio sp. KJ40-1]MDB1124996.1 SDR family NAD(P)-dependent oxidoreductase [Vibrio sp. KJ40-1]
MRTQTTLIVGANSEIAKAIASEVINLAVQQLIIVSRDTEFYKHSKFRDTKVIKVKNYQEKTINSVVKSIGQLNTLNISKVFVCHGLLHNDNIQPEKRLSEFSSDNFVELLTANTVTPMLWLKCLVPLLSGKQACKIVVFSARVGSINDNNLGGWYSYRASKAAVNMLLKSAAVELARSAKNIKLISFHPGTTDSPLSKPFHKNVPVNKLFKSEFVAKQLIDIVQKTPLDGEVSFVDWQGKSIPW